MDYELANEDEISLEVAVEDTGIGIKREDLSKLFSAFERIDEERNRTIEGTGLGMNIVWRLLNLMGSSLQVDSKYGEGSKFSFSVRQKVVNWEAIGSVEEALHNLDEEREVYHSSFIAPDAKILLVDDDPDYLKLVSRWLSGRYRVVIVNSGMQAITFLGANRPDLILLDYSMPVTTGPQVLEMIRSEQSTQNIPVIFLTGKDDSESVRRVLELKPNGYILKNINRDALIERLEEFFASIR